MSPKASEAASNKERILSSKTACRGFESYCPCQIDIAKAVSFFFAKRQHKQEPRHAERVVGCGSPVETSAKQKHRPSRQARSGSPVETSAKQKHRPSRQARVESYCPCQIDIAKAVSFIFYQYNKKSNKPHKKPVVLILSFSFCIKHLCCGYSRNYQHHHQH